MNRFIRIFYVEIKNNNNNNIHICIAPYGRNFRGAENGDRSHQYAVLV